MCFSNKTRLVVAFMVLALFFVSCQKQRITIKASFPQKIDMVIGQKCIISVLGSTDSIYYIGSEVHLNPYQHYETTSWLSIDTNIVSVKNINQNQRAELTARTTGRCELKGFYYDDFGDQHTITCPVSVSDTGYTSINILDTIVTYVGGSAQFEFKTSNLVDQSLVQLADGVADLASIGVWNYEYFKDNLSVGMLMLTYSCTIKGVKEGMVGLKVCNDTVNIDAIIPIKVLLNEQ